MKGMRSMKIFEILDYENNRSVGVLLYYEKKKDFIVELQEDLDEWTAPLLFAELVKRHIYTAPRDMSYLWVKERVIPSGRQNISQILKNQKMEAYDEMKFLELANGKCAQDSLYIRKIDEVPKYVTDRKKTIVDCVACGQHSILCFFVDESVRKIELQNFTDVEGVKKVLHNDMLYQSCMVGTGGYFITFNDSIDIPSSTLYERGEKLPLTRNDFICFARNNLLDTSESCDLLECSRQNIAYLVRKEQLEPMKEDIKGNLYLKGEVLRQTW